MNETNNYRPFNRRELMKIAGNLSALSLGLCGFLAVSTPWLAGEDFEDDFQLFGGELILKRKESTKQYLHGTQVTERVLLQICATKPGEYCIGEWNTHDKRFQSGGEIQRHEFSAVETPFSTDIQICSFTDRLRVYRSIDGMMEKDTVDFIGHGDQYSRTKYDNKVLRRNRIPGERKED